MRKIFIAFIVFAFCLSTTNAWLGLIAENGDLLNIAKWNELVNDKLSRNNLKAGINIFFTNSGDDIFINGTFELTPFISNENQIWVEKNITTSLTLTGYNFTPNTQVTTSAGNISNIEVYSPVKLSFDLAAGSVEGDFDIVLNNSGSLNTLWTNNGKNLIKVINIVRIVGDDTSGRKWEDGTYAKTCNDYKNPTSPYSYSGNTGDGVYLIKPDSNKSEFKVYCDMTTDSGGWTRFVDIKGDYSLQDAIDCWLGINVDNANLECFNPNRYSIGLTKLMNIDWSGNYTYTMIDSNSSVDTQSSAGSRECLGHDEYMTIMRGDTSPNPDGSDASYVRLARSFCKYSRDPAGRGGSFMNYDNSGDFGESTDAARESNARATQIYFK